MKRLFLILVTIFALATSGCNMLVRLPIGSPDLISTETFTVNEAIPGSATITNTEITLAPSNGSVTLAGNSDRLASGEIRYNVADWKPAVVIDGSTLHIEQDIPDNNISSTPKNSINEWDLKLAGTLTNIAVSLSAGNYTLALTDTLPDGAVINVTAGVGNLRLEFPAGVIANVEIHRGPANIAMEGTWMKDGKVYTSGNTGSVWTVTVDFGVGNLTLASK